MEKSDIASCLSWAKTILCESESPALDAELLLAKALDKNRTYLFTWPEKLLGNSEFALFKQFVERRLHGEPIAYIVGEQGFWTLTLKVNASTLIPRPETELLVELALDLLANKAAQILDLGTGTGAIALALASENPTFSVLGLDCIPEAVQLATENQQQCGITNAAFELSHWFSVLDDQARDGDDRRRFDLIVSNPPYIDSSDPHLSLGDVRFEPKSALVADQEGLADIQLIANQAHHYLLDGGWLMFEHGYDQGESARKILTALGYQRVETFQDVGDRDRVTRGQWFAG